jgi:hypothetical protein
MKNKILERKYICTSSGYLAPRAICGKVSVAEDSKGHRCCEHGNTKCKFKEVIK